MQRTSFIIGLTLAWSATFAQAATYTATLRQDEFSNGGHAPFTLSFTNVPAPAAGGTLRVRAKGDFSSSAEYLDVTAESISLGQIFDDDQTNDRFNAPSDHGYDNIVLNGTATLSLSEFQTLAADGIINVTIDPSQSVNDLGAGEFVEVIITYDAISAGACCIATSETCQDLTPEACTTAGGTFAGSGTNCSTFVCFPKGACCLPDGGCQGDLVTPEQCTTLGGTFQGHGSTCATSDCRIKGACCKDGDCTIQAADDCAASGGSYGGGHTTCTGDADGDGVLDACDACPATIPDASVDASGCPPFIKADFNRDGDVDGDDFSTFLSCVSGPAVPRGTNCANRDFDNDQDVDMNDFGLFQRCFSGQGWAADPDCD